MAPAAVPAALLLCVAGDGSAQPVTGADNDVTWHMPGRMAIGSAGTPVPLDRGGSNSFYQG